MFQYHTVEEALEELRQGRMILCTDDPDRENEGDLICAAEFATTENVNFMATHGKGLICMPMSYEYVKKLQFPQMVTRNTDNHETAFTVSIDHVDTTTGISAAERSITAMKCVDPDAKPEDFRRPGHMFPLLAKDNGVLERNGHTEATVDLMRLAGLKEVGLCCEIMREDGTMMRAPELQEMSKKWGLKFITIKDLQAYRKRHEVLVDRVTVTKCPPATATSWPTATSTSSTASTMWPWSRVTSATARTCSAGSTPSASPAIPLAPCAATAASSWRQPCPRSRRKAGACYSICARRAGASA